MSCFYSKSGSGEQKPQKREPSEAISRKLIMRKLITIALTPVYSFFDKTEEMSPFASLRLNTGIFFGWQFNDSIYIVKNVRVFLRFPNFNPFLDYPYYAGYPVSGTKPLVRIWLLNIAMFISI